MVRTRIGPGRWTAGAGLLLALLGAWWAAMVWLAAPHGSAGGEEAAVSWSALALAGLVLVAALSALLGAALARQRFAGALQQARGERQALMQLIEGHYWRSDGSHRLSLVMPLGDAGDRGPWRAGIAPWEAADDAAAAERLRARMDARLPVEPVDVAAAGGDWRLCAAPLFDALGRFEGYAGTARAVAAPVPAAGVADPGAGEAGVYSDPEAFSYTVSHDLRAPIRVVEGFTRIVKEDYGRVLDRIGLDHLDRVLGAAARMNNMIDALLELSKLATQPLARQPVNLSQLAGYVVDDLRRAAPERQVAVRIQPDLIVAGDPTLLRVVLENLLGNAWKYSARNPEASIRFEAGGTSSAQVFTVRDNGAGFDMRYADRLFGVFQRLHSASDFQGTGVGLATVRRIVRRHGGEIWAESEVGRGAAFHFTLKA